MTNGGGNHGIVKNPKQSGGEKKEPEQLRPNSKEVGHEGKKAKGTEK